MPNESDRFLIDQEQMEGCDLAELIASRPGPLAFSGVDFSARDLSRLDLRNARFERCLFASSDLTAAKLDGSQWLGCRAAEAVFVSATLVDADFSRCDLNNSKWQRSKLAQASFTGCKLTGANFADSASLGISFDDCVLRSACLSGMSFYKSELRSLDFAEADLSHCDFRKAVFLDGGSLSLARVNDARFDQADLREASLDGLRLVDAKLFKGAIISRAQASMLLAGLGLTVL
ncbi:Uncharacterized protein YjbI, contains pentapeptide repeats [Pseudomonas flavescens]|uniref:Uncharacterized protein YjbI, contains pentapeptide repeats n=1 Tax=Phytopseudomonas flavescens TaxID=29435 RepID=A0A1G7Y085_9GAMM|nr:pentapeptide repeat-containing protein [Pseudomonas flavescens]SDG89858.1 Uncharacterized protein YjbI, contains pentapeptide repeats [Pseudomonas flavescens]